jgi:hypothetical protein
MKTRNFLNVNQITTTTKWENSLVSTFMQSGLRCWSVLLFWLSLVKTKVKSLSLTPAIQALRTGLTASLLAPLSQMIRNKRHVLGVLGLLVGVASVFAHQFFLDMYAEPHDVCRVLHFSDCYNRETKTGWCYMSWFYYYETVRFCIAAIFLTVAGFLFVPPNKSVAVIFFSVLQGAAWTGLFHYSFSVDSHETYHMVPHWHFMVVGLMLGFGIIISADHLSWIWNHRVLAFEKRLETLYNGCDLVADDKFKGLFKKFVEEKRAFQKQY